MNRDRIQEYITHPVFISLMIWLIVILFIPPVFSKYRISHIKDEFTNYKNKYFFIDLDADQISEKILIDYNDSLQTKVQVLKENKVHDQYDLKYRPGNGDYLFAGDYNRDSYKELYIFTQSTDSIFLHIIDPVNSRKIIVTNRFIDIKRKAKQSFDEPQVMEVGMIEGTGKNFLDYAFIINTGYSLQPRNIYLYKVSEDILIKSPESSASLFGCTVAEINHDSLPEMILDVMAPGNFGENDPYSDRFSWLMVLNRDLNFIFEPVRFRQYPCKLRVLPIKLENKCRLVLFLNYFGTEEIHSSFYLFDSEGRKISESPISDLENNYSDILANDEPGKQTFYFLKNRNAEVEELDSSFYVINTMTIPKIEQTKPLAHLDADLDGKKEYILEGANNESLVITQHNFSHSVSFVYKKSSGFPYISQILYAHEKPMLYLQFNDFGSYIRFNGNPLYYLKFPFYIALYLAVLFFVLLIARIQNYRLRLEQETERKIAALQMKAIKNQIDPHFTLNMLNAIGSLYATDANREEADYIFGKYAKLIRQTVISSDQIIITLAEELDLIRNYVDLEQWRCNHAFKYDIDIDKGIDLQRKIPRMLIYTFVENTVKYGLRSNPQGGMLKIRLQSGEGKYQVIVEDNGPGLETPGTAAKGTGKGLVILKELTDLYYKLEKVRITYLLNEIIGTDGIVEGTRAVIEIPD